MFKGFVAAVQFLTRIPININVPFDSDNLSKSTFFFPLVGVIIGAISALIYYLFSYININIAAFAAVVAIILLTGGLHIDGLSDTCDGFFSARTKEKILEIMKDSRTGSFGVIAIVLDILLKYILISNIKPNIIFAGLIISCASARLLAAFLMSLTKSARPGGLGDMFAAAKPYKYVLISGIIYVIIVAFINPYFLISIGAVSVAGLLINIKSYNTIGGLTGDVFGAAIELGEIISLAAFAFI